MYYEDYSDQDIIDFLKNTRRMGVIKDLFRHEWVILKIKLRITKQHNKEDIIWLREWSQRLKNIIKKKWLKK